MIEPVNRASLFLFVLLGIFVAACTRQAKRLDYYKLPKYQSSPEITAIIVRDSVNLDLLEWAIFSETNVQRRRLGLSPFKYDPQLRKAARLHSQEMVALNYVDHTSPDPLNASVQKRLKRVGIKHGFSGENIAVHPINKKLEVVFNHDSQFTESSRYTWRNKGMPYTYQEFASELVERWMKSPGHRRNILNLYFKFLGVGCVKTKSFQSDVFYVTQDFSSTNY